MCLTVVRINKIILIVNVSYAFYPAKNRYLPDFLYSYDKVLKCGAGEGWRRSVGPIM